MHLLNILHIMYVFLSHSLTMYSSQPGFKYAPYFLVLPSTSIMRMYQNIQLSSCILQDTISFRYLTKLSVI